MPWLRIEDGEWCAPWVLTVGSGSYGMYVRLSGYCAKNLTDGLVPAAIVALIVGIEDEELQRLVDVGRVRKRRTGAIVLPYYLDANQTAAAAEVRREMRAAAGRRGGLAKAQANGRHPA